MYLGVLCILLCEAMLLGSTLILIYAGIVFVSFHLFVLLYEEPHLRRQYGKVYMDYCRAVPRWWFARRPFNGENRAA
jgi:protein-S-isoprenylcysteine O-methyltransferase Ste14